MSNDDSTQEGGWLVTQLARGVTALGRLPHWAVPPLVGAALLSVITLFRGAFLLLARPADPRSFLAFMLALLVAPAAGAVAGFVYVLIRRPLRPLQAFGDLITGAVLGWVYLFALLLPARYLFGDDTLKTPNDWVVATFFGAGFGVVVTVVYWYNMWRVRREGGRP